MNPDFTKALQHMKQLQETLRNIELKVLKAEVFAAIVAVGLIVLLSFSRMLLRNISGLGLEMSWAPGFTSMVKVVLPHLVLLVGFIGASIGITKREVIQMDVLKRNYPAMVRAIISAISYLALAVVIYFYLTFAITSAQMYPEARSWLLFGYVPTIGMLMFKSVLVAINPQIEQDLGGGDDASKSESTTGEPEAPVAG